MFTIGKIAKLTEVSTDAIRHYEKEGLLKPSLRSESGYRLYDKSNVQRLHFIKHAQNSGFSLQEIGELLKYKNEKEACCKDVRSLAVHKKLFIENKIKSLTIMSKALDHFLTVCKNDDAPVEDCPILTALEKIHHDQN